MKRVFQLLACLVAGAVLAGPAQASPKQLKGAEITKLLTGRTLYSPPDKGQSIQRFEAGGVTLYQSESKQLQGRWKVVGDTYCSSWDDKTEPKCFAVFVEPPAVAFVGPDGTKNILFLTK